MLSTVSDNQKQERQQAICLEYLAMTREDAEQVAHTRLHYVKLSRLYGLTNRQIGEALGVTEAAVRAMIVRAS